MLELKGIIPAIVCPMTEDAGSTNRRFAAT